MTKLNNREGKALIDGLYKYLWNVYEVPATFLNYGFIIWDWDQQYEIYFISTPTHKCILHEYINTLKTKKKASAYNIYVYYILFTFT